MQWLLFSRCFYSEHAQKGYTVYCCLVSHQTVVPSIYPRRTYSLENLPKQPCLDWPQCFLPRNHPKQVLPLADTYHVTKQSEIQSGDFLFLANANKPLRLPVSLLTNLSQISLFWYVMGIKVKLVIRAL